MSNRDIEMQQAVEAAARDDALNSDPYVRRTAANEPAQVYSVRIPVDRLEQLRQAAHTAGKRPTTFIREIVIDYLDSAPLAAVVQIRASQPASEVDQQLWRQLAQ